MPGITTIHESMHWWRLGFTSFPDRANGVIIRLKGTGKALQRPGIGLMYARPHAASPRLRWERVAMKVRRFNP